VHCRPLLGSCRRVTTVTTDNAGQLTACGRHRIGAISRKAQRRGVLCTDFDTHYLIVLRFVKSILLNEYDDDTVYRKLFAHITDPNHCLHHLLPPTAHRSYSLQKDNMVISYLTLNIISIKTVSSIAVSLTLGDYCFLHHIQHSGLYSTITPQPN